RENVVQNLQACSCRCCRISPYAPALRLRPSFTNTDGHRRANSPLVPPASRNAFSTLILLKILEFDRLEEIRLRAGPQSLLYVAAVARGCVEPNRGVRIGLAKCVAQSDPGPVRQPVVQDVKVEVAPPG